MTREKIWQVPSLRTDEDLDKHRKVSWLELFFDLFFVVTISQLSHLLANDISSDGIAEFAMLFVPVWWVWIGATYYIERFETTGIDMRIFTFLLMLPVAGLAIFAHGGTDSTYTGFTMSYAFARIIITFMWFRAGVHEKRFRRVAFIYSAGFTLSIVLVLLSNLMPVEIRSYFFVAALIIDLVTPFFTFNIQSKLPRYSTSRLPERFGLFVLIVLGESIVSVVNGISTLSFVYDHMYVTGMLGIAISFGFWWIYFDFIGRRPFKPGIVFSALWGYLHLPLVMTFSAMGAALLYIIRHGYTVDFNKGRVLYSAAFGLNLIVMGLIEKTLRRDKDEPTSDILSPGLKIGAGFIAIAFSLFTGRSDNILMLICLLCLLLLQMGYGMYVWFSRKNEITNE